MPTHDAFLKTILADPVQAAPYLVYADWLEEQGDERGDRLRACGGDCSRMASVLWPPERIDPDKLSSFDTHNRNRLIYIGIHMLLLVERPLVVLTDGMAIGQVEADLLSYRTGLQEFRHGALRIAPPDGGSLVQLEMSGRCVYEPPHALSPPLVIHGRGNNVEIRLRLDIRQITPADDPRRTVVPRRVLI